MDLMTLRSLPKSGPVGSASVTSLSSYRSQTLVTPPGGGSPPSDTGTSSHSGSEGEHSEPRKSSLAPSSDASDEGNPHTQTRSDAPLAALRPRTRADSPPPATRGITALSPWSKGLRGTKQEAAARWTRRQIESRHHFVIVRTRPRRGPLHPVADLDERVSFQWPLVALLLVFTIVTIEVQMVANDVYAGVRTLPETCSSKKDADLPTWISSE